MRSSIRIWIIAGACLGFLVALYGWRGGNSSLFLVLSLFFVVLQGAVVQLGGPKAAVVTRSWSPVTPSVGDDVEVTLSITVSGGFPPLWLEVRDNFAVSSSRSGKSISEGQRGLLWFAGFRREYTGTYSLKELPRGIYVDGPILVTWGDAFGWFKRSLYIEGQDVLIVHPSSLKFVSSLVEGMEEGNDDAEISSLPKASSQVGGGLREYEAGDPLRRINWKSSAKRGTLMTRIPDETGRAPHYLLLDTRSRSYTQPPNENGTPEMSNLQGTNRMFELAVSAAAAWLKREVASEKGDIYFCHGGMEDPLQLSGNRGLSEGLDMLADVLQDSKGLRPISEMFQRVNLHRSGGYPLLTVVTGIMTTELAECLLKLTYSGVQPEVWCVYSAAASTEVNEWSTRLRESGVVIRYLSPSRGTHSRTAGGTSYVSA
ncbi:DUF58 domain-containing protein [Paenibacillus sp. FSL K6-2524]|uniref:DUF58 domain-containing protein n=1 Tax=Paenibacillus sp. FSL K6-2524 TaxID=2954516 RepID=UPI0030F96053